MVESNRAVPFGLLFEESAPEPQNFIAPIYDEETDLSYVEDPHGYWVPYVEFGGAIGTVTATKVRREATDTDPGDDRAGYYAIGATVTHTRIRAESTDTDPDESWEYHPVKVSIVGTQTVTEMKGESTDKD